MDEDVPVIAMGLAGASSSLVLVVMVMLVVGV
jgi:hypothetical protein